MVTWDSRFSHAINEALYLDDTKISNLLFADDLTLSQPNGVCNFFEILYMAV